MNAHSGWRTWDDSALFMRELPDVPRIVTDPQQRDELDASPLPADEPLALPSGVDLPPELLEALTHAEDEALSIGGPEFRTALRRMVSRVAEVSPDALRVLPEPRRAAASLIAAISSINGIMDISDERPSRILGQLEVDEVVVRETASGILRALGWTVMQDVPYLLVHPDLTVSWVRREMLEDPDEDEWGFEDEWDDEAFTYDRIRTSPLRGRVAQGDIDGALAQVRAEMGLH